MKKITNPPNIRFILNAILSLGYFLFLSKANSLLGALSFDSRMSMALQGSVWFVITILINSLTSKSPRQYLQNRSILVGFIIFFVYYLGSGTFLNARLFMVANLEAYWASLILFNLGLNLERTTGKKVSLGREDNDFVIYYLWLMFFTFFILLPSFFFGPDVGVIIGPALIAAVTFYTNRISCGKKPLSKL